MLPLAASVCEVIWSHLLQEVSVAGRRCEIARSSGMCWSLGIARQAAEGAKHAERLDLQRGVVEPVGERKGRTGFLERSWEIPS